MQLVQWVFRQARHVASGAPSSSWLGGSGQLEDDSTWIAFNSNVRYALATIPSVPATACS